MSFLKNKPFKCFVGEYENREIISRSYQGVKPIEIEKILGTVGRCHDNSSWKQMKDNKRFRAIKDAIDGMESMPAIKVYQVQDEYYIVDGHHRVMASRDLNRHFIDAEVIEYKFKETEGERIAADYHDCPAKDFSEKTALSGIILKSRKSYDKLLSMIKEFGKEVKENLSLEELSIKWYYSQFLDNQENIKKDLDEDDKEN
ncbi:ParB/Srx family N-terminal domain-containing protein [Natronospora cellulosivora (SeqCode)]